MTPVRKLVIFLLLLWMGRASAQWGGHELIQFSGRVLSKVQKEPIPYASVLIASTHRGTIANLQGFFAIVAKPGDTLRISAMGFKPVYIPVRSIEGGSVFRNVYLEVDTLLLEEVRVYPWISPLHLKQAFLHMPTEDDFYTIALRNLQEALVREYLRQAPLGASGNQDMVIQEFWQQQYTAGGQLPVTYWNVGGRAVPAPFLNYQFWRQLVTALRELRR